MTDFGAWCDPVSDVQINGHRASVLVSMNDESGIVAVAGVLAEQYARTETLSLIASGMGKPGVSKFLEKKFPAKPGSRSGDMGEILAAAYLEENCGFMIGPSRLIHRDHHEWAMRGDDVLGAKFEGESSVRVIKAEAKSRVRMGGAVVTEAREGLQRGDGLPSPHSLAQFAERLLDSPDKSLGEAVMKLQLVDGVRPEMITHLMFLFTTNDPSKYVKGDLDAYTGLIDQITMTLRVTAHQEFIRRAYEKALSDDT